MGPTTEVTGRTLYPTSTMGWLAGKRAPISANTRSKTLPNTPKAKQPPYTRPQHCSYSVHRGGGGWDYGKGNRKVLCNKFGHNAQAQH